MRKNLLTLLFMALLIPWTTQTKAQCDAADMCSITVVASDSYGDGWDGSTLSIHQGSTLIGNVSVTASSSTYTFQICPDSIQLSWISNSWFDSECAFTIYDRGGGIIFSTSSCYSYSGTFATVNATCPTCFIPLSFSEVGNTPTSATLQWTDTSSNLMQIAYGPMNFNPDSIDVTFIGTLLTNVSGTSIVINDLSPDTTYHFYIRSDCGTEQSTWVGPLAIRPGCYLMGVTGSDTLRTCGMTITDDGGVVSDYSSGCNSILVVYPSSPDSVISFSGIVNVENNYDYLYIYSGVGTNGQLLGSYCGNTVIEPTISEVGPITIRFSSDYGGNYEGFEINVTCLEAPSCPRILDLTTVSLDNQSITVSWLDTTYTYSYQLEYDTVGFEVGMGNIENTSDTVYQITNLLPDTEYELHVRMACYDGSYSLERVLRFRTACDPITADSLPYVETFNDLALSSCWKVLSSDMSRIVPTIDNSRLKLYNHGLATWSVVTLPLFETPINELTINFNVFTDEANNTIEVGVMSDPEDISTFTTIGSFTSVAANQWANYTAYGAAYTGEGTFIAFRAPGSQDYATFYIDSVVVDQQPLCSTPQFLRAVAVGHTSAILAWDANAVGETIEYEVEISEVGTNTWTALPSTSNLITTISGLDLATSYNVRVRTICSDDNSEWVSITFNTKSCVGAGTIDTTIAPNTLMIGDSNSTSTNDRIPAYGYYCYSYSQQLFLAEELGNLGTITKASFDYVSTNPLTRNIAVYMGTTSETNLRNDFINTNYTQVFSGNVTFTTGQNLIEFSTPFAYGADGNLVLLVLDNTGSYTDGEDFRTTSTAEAMTRVIYTDGSAYSATSIPTGYPSAYNERNNIIFYGYPCNSDATNACLPPIVTVTDIQVDQASLLWAPGNTETSWTIDYRTTDDSTWTIIASSTNVDSITISDLTPNTNYIIRVTAECGSSTASSTVEVYTSCDKIDAYPFVENFDGVTGSVPSCWYGMSTYSTSMPNTSENYDYNDNGKALNMYCYSYNTNDETMYTMVVSPQIDTNIQPINTLQVSFALYRSSDYYTHAGMIVGVITDPTDIATFTPMDTVYITSESMWENFEVILSNYQGAGEYIALVSKPFGITTNDVYLDNFQINVAPPCARPTNIAANATSITTTSATISWSATAAQEYIIEYGPYGFELGTGTIVTSYEDYITLTGLSSSRYYDVYVRGVCDNIDSSLYSFRYSFNTACGEIETLPFAEDFNNWNGLGLDIPYCWSRSVNDYPYFSTRNYGTGTGKSMYFNFPSSIYTTNNNTLSLPAMSSSIDITNTMVSFKMITPFSSETYIPGIIVGIATDPLDISTFTPIDTIMASLDWTSHEVYFNNYADTGRYITFVTYAELMGEYAYPDLNIDNIVVETLPSCPRTSDLATRNATSTSVDLYWNNIGNASSWLVEYGPIGFTEGTGTQVVANSNPFTLTGLASATTYEYNVRAICSATDSGEFALDRCRFSTTQNAASVPYLYNFENESEWNNWQTSSNVAANWYRGNATAGEGSYSMYISNDNGATNSTTFSTYVNATTYRDIDFGTVDSNFILTFKTKVGRTNDASSTYDGLAVILENPSTDVISSSSSFTSPWGRVDQINSLVGYFAYNDSSWHTVNIPLDNISGVHRLAFYWFNVSTGYYYEYIGTPAAVDSISVVYATCPRPTNLQDSATSTEAYLSWEGSATGYIVSYYNVAETSITNVYTTSNTYTLTGLTPGRTTYEWAVRSVCGTDTSIYSTASSFSTECFDGAISVFPFTEEFEADLSCWEQVQDINNLYFEWATATTMTTESGDLLPYNGSSFAKFESSSFDPVTSTLISPVLDLSSVINPTLEYAYIIPEWFGDYDTLGIYYRVHQDSAWVYITSYNTPVESWQTNSIALPNASTTYQLAFVGTSFYGYGIGLDRVIVSGENTTCPAPALTASVVNNSATISWTTVGDYEMKYRKVTDNDFGTVITVANAGNYTLSGLYPNTEYVCAVRRNCGAELGYSDWSEINFTTEDLPCEVPTNITVSNITYTSATIGWTAPENQIEWEVRYMTGSRDTTIITNSNPVVLENLYSGEYQVWVRAFCGNDTYSEWTDVFTFSTTACEMPSNVAVSNVTNSSAVVTWTSTAQKWEISYGMEGVNEENGTKVTVEGTASYTIEGLDYETTYDVYVRAICEDGVYSAWTPRTQFTTDGIGINSAATDNADVRIYPNPANTEATVTVDGINGKVEFVVADMNGRMIVTETITCEGSLVKTIDVSNLAKGAYFVHIYNDNFNTTRKLIVK